MLALKGNQETVHEEVKSYLDDAIIQQAALPARKTEPKRAPELAYTETVEKDHGRMEMRRYWQSGRLDWFADRAKWEGLRSVGVVESVRQVGSETPTVERRYYLSSLAVDVEKFAQAVRGHWGVENALHWCLGVQMGEDQIQARTRHAAGIWPARAVTKLSSAGVGSINLGARSASRCSRRSTRTAGSGRPHWWTTMGWLAKTSAWRTWTAMAGWTSWRPAAPPRI